MVEEFNRRNKGDYICAGKNEEGTLANFKKQPSIVYKGTSRSGICGQKQTYENLFRIPRTGTGIIFSSVLKILFVFLAQEEASLEISNYYLAT